MDNPLHGGSSDVVNDNQEQPQKDRKRPVSGAYRGKPVSDPAARAVRREAYFARLRQLHNGAGTALSLCGALMLLGCSQNRITHGIPNLHCVDSKRNIWRGGQPSVDGWRWVENQGIKSIVKLNSEEELKSNLQLNSFPISFEEQVTRVQPDLVAGAVMAITDNCLVHCEHGQDRTGLVVAFYRERQGWTKAKAEKEMLKYGFHKELRGLWECWEDQ